MTSRRARIICLNADLFPSARGFGQTDDGLDDDKLEDLLAYFDPDGIFLTGTEYNSLALSTIDRVTDLPVFAPGWKQKTSSEDLNGISVFAVKSTNDLDALEHAEQNAMIDPTDTTVVLNNELSLSVDTESLQTTLQGLDDYKQHFNHLSGNYTHISGHLDGDYEHTWGDMNIYGAGPVETRNKPSITCLDIYANGRVTRDFLDSHKLGIQAINGLGPQTTRTLANEGYDSRDAIADANINDLEELSGIGEKTAKKYVSHARALEHNNVVRTDDDPLPGRAPLFIDIETDGLSPTIIWEIGVLDSKTGKYHDYMVKDPDEKGKAITQFLVDLTNKWGDRILIAWNGNSFDFKHLSTHIQRYAPDFMDAWNSTYKLDLLYWADTKGNAILPGRTNKLEHVSEALGYERNDTDLTGREVGERYRTWMRNPVDENELDWGDHKRYCEHDVRALAAIYEAIEDAEMAAMPGNDTTQRQQSLMDF